MKKSEFFFYKMGLETLLNGQTAAGVVGSSFNMEELMKRFSITGNIMLDTMILMNACD